MTSRWPTLTIHKSQGSEYPAVLIPLTLSHSIMLRRRLLYTAVTRGKDKVVLVADVEALKLAVSAMWEAPRATGLRLRLESRNL